MRSHGNPAVKIEGGGGQQRYLYTVKIGNFRQILMSSLVTNSFKKWKTRQLPIGTGGSAFMLERTGKHDV